MQGAMQVTTKAAHFNLKQLLPDDEMSAPYNLHRLRQVQRCAMATDAGATMS
jgi:hypothetical protein